MSAGLTREQWDSKLEEAREAADYGSWTKGAREAMDRAIEACLGPRPVPPRPKPWVGVHGECVSVVPVGSEGGWGVIVAASGRMDLARADALLAAVKECVDWVREATPEHEEGS